MNAITKLAGVAIGAMSVVAVVAVAQPNAGTESTMNPATANYGTPPGAPLKRDGSLSASGVATGTVDTTQAPATNTWSSTQTTTTTTAAPAPTPAPAAEPAPVAAAPADTSSTDTSPALTPRADRN